ncbi:MAG: helix-turn-helix domain-containing protein [Chitinophagaceae bacterium]|nr:helix-turn-helix domain-containing protein [Chitinophagaceae bacterium]
MRKENIHQPMEVVYKKIDRCPTQYAQHTFFQMTYVISGAGTLSLNGHEVDYNEGNLMLLNPNDRHIFHISSTTEFLHIRFQSQYIKEYRWKNIAYLECLLYYSSHLMGCIMRSDSDGTQVRRIVESLLQSIEENDLFNEELMTHYVNALIVIAARNISKIKPEHIKVNTDQRIQELINYVQSNICYPEKLTATAMAGAFGISSTYLGSYFKKQCGETLQHFIAGYRLRLIELRLQFSDMRINEIAAEFGFTDESHLNKFFKKHNKISLTAYRRSLVSQS